MNFKITFHMNGRGVYHDVNEPTHLDSLICYAMLPDDLLRRRLLRDEMPEEIDMTSVLERHPCGTYHASALFCDDVPESLRFWRKKFNVSAARNVTKGSPNLTNAIYREYNTPVPLILTRNLHAFASGDGDSIKVLLDENISHIGKKRAYGYGKILDISIDEQDDDHSLIRDEQAMRWLPYKEGFRQVRLTPPYWSGWDAVHCCEVGDEIKENNIR